MKKISGSTFLHKKIVPAFFFVFLAFFVMVPLLSGEDDVPHIVIIVFPLIMAIFVYKLFKNMVWDLVDEVYDNGEELVFRNGSKEQRVPLRDIINVSYSRMSSPERVEVLVRNGGPLGRELVFTPQHASQSMWNPFARSPIVDDLIKRVDRARNT